MSKQEQLIRLAERAFRGKEARRKAVVKLPVEEKFAILLNLQRIASEIRKSNGKRKPTTKNS
jgi:hypothetical protein